MVEGLRGDNKEKAEVAMLYRNMGVPFNDINKRFDIGFEDYPDEWATEGGKPKEELTGLTPGPSGTEETIEPAPTKVFLKLLEQEFDKCCGQKYVNLLNIKFNLNETSRQFIVDEIDKAIKYVKGKMILAGKGLNDEEKALAQHVALVDNLNGVKELASKIGQAVVREKEKQCR